MKALLNWSERRGWRPLAVLLICAFFVVAAVRSTGFAHADPFQAPNPGDFVSGSIQCSTQLGTTPEKNQIRVTAKWVGKNSAMFRVYTMDRNLKPLNWVIDNENRNLTFKINGTEEAGTAIQVRAWDGNPEHTTSLDITMSGIAPDQYYGFAASYTDGKVVAGTLNTLVTARAGDKDCVVMD